MSVTVLGVLDVVAQPSSVSAKLRIPGSKAGSGRLARTY